jgi:two-component system NtrC family sensor kinase
VQRFRQGLRQKITLGYYIAVAVILGISVFTFMELRFLEKKITQGEIISEFFNTTLEIRRFEKNYFLISRTAIIRRMPRISGRPAP